MTRTSMPMSPIMRCLTIAVLAASCGGTSRPGPVSAASVSSICGGYEDILSLPDRPLTPCEVETQTEMTRRPQLWSGNFNGVCQFVELQVIVDSLGRLEPGSPSILRTNAPGVASDAVRKVGETPFRPGRRAGVPVRQVRRYYFASPGAQPRCGL